MNFSPTNFLTVNPILTQNITYICLCIYHFWSSTKVNFLFNASGHRWKFLVLVFVIPLLWNDMNLQKWNRLYCWASHYLVVDYTFCLILLKIFQANCHCCIVVNHMLCCCTVTFFSYQNYFGGTIAGIFRLFM